MVTTKKIPKLEWFNGDDLLGDCCIMQEILSQIEYYSGTERKKMLKVSPKIGGSMLYGLTWRAYLKKHKETGEIITRKKDPVSGLYYTKVMEQYPELKEIFAEFADQYFPDFHYTQTQLNKNFPCPPHRDAANQGESILISFGDYTGGKTAVDLGNEIYKADSHYKPFKFNGSKYEHWVEDYKGERYSLVFFSRFKKLII
tara:strand:+ start:552 stop:1151 length:600 start_codon:yes stop_codon:yes gene_type:complete